MTALRQRMLEDADSESLAAHATRVPRERGPIRATLPSVPDGLGSRRDSHLPGVSDLREKARPQFDRDRGLRAALSLQGHAQTPVVVPRRDPRTEKAASLAGGTQPRRSGPFSHLCHAPRASDDPDDLLRRRLAHLGGRPPPADRYRQWPDGDPHRTGEGPARSVRDAVPESADDVARLVVRASVEWLKSFFMPRGAS